MKSVMGLLAGVLLSQSAMAASDISLKQAYAPHFLVGTALSMAQIEGKDPAALGVVQQHFNALTAENVMKWEELQPKEGDFHFGPADALLKLAEQQQATLIGHTLLWHQQTPAWVFTGPDGKTASKALLLQRLTTHINTVVGRYKGKVKGWDVVNEALNDDGSLRDSPWRKILGDDYIVTAFQLAQAADPAAELYYNDYNLYNPEKRQGAVRIVQQLQKAGVKLTGVGMQGHYGLDYPDLQQVEDSIVAFAATGAQVMITELDITVLPRVDDNAIGADISLNQKLQQQLNPYSQGLPAAIEALQQQRFTGLFRIFLRHSDTISRVTLWGVNDQQSWRNNWPMQGRTDYALLFDRQNQPKAVVKALLNLVDEVKP
ncbi:endo-1,4-beta-xylanase [Rheinheimera sp.]|uniref:endo-1,4-beta-xylanase n=1 Tax=Rheinheimera sp. TaxID=1869214 RepID=UPI00307CD172